MKELLKAGCTAVFAANDAMSLRGAPGHRREALQSRTTCDGRL